MMLDAQLHITEAGWSTRIIAVRDIMTIGRDSDNDIILESITVSRCHAVLVRHDADVLLVDLASTNGTLLNGLPLQPDEPVLLNDGDEVQFGQALARYVALHSTTHQPHDAAK